MAGSPEIDGRIERLHETFGDFPVETGDYELDDGSYERALELREAGIPGAVRVWVERDSDTLLVREASRPDSWGVAGGFIEQGETAIEAGEREVAEETGIECKIFDVAYVHRATRRHHSGQREPLEDFAVAFLAEYVDGNVRVQDGEIRSVAWWSELPDATHDPATRIGKQRLD